jgi:Lytic transglycolase
MLRKNILAAFLLCGVALSAHAETGIASVYRPSDPDGGGLLAANGEQIDTDALIAAHKSLPFGMLVRVTNKRSGLSAVVRINDRGPDIAPNFYPAGTGVWRVIELLPILGPPRWHFSSLATIRAGRLPLIVRPARSGFCCRSRCEGVLRCSLYAKPRIFASHRRGSRTNVHSGTPLGISH